MEILNPTNYTIKRDFSCQYLNFPPEYYENFEMFKKNYVPQSDVELELVAKTFCHLEDIDDLDFKVIWKISRNVFRHTNEIEPDINGEYLKQSVGETCGNDERILWNIPNTERIHDVSGFNFLQPNLFPYELMHCRVPMCMVAKNKGFRVSQDFYTPVKYVAEAPITDFMHNITVRGDTIVPCFEGRYEINPTNNFGSEFILNPIDQLAENRVPLPPYKFFANFFRNQNILYNTPIFTQFVKQEYTSDISNKGFLFVLDGQVVIENSITLNPKQVFTYDAGNSLSIKATVDGSVVVGCTKLLNTPNTSGDLNRFFV